MAARKYYKTTITYVVLSETPITEDTSLSAVVQACESDDCVCLTENREAEELKGKEMADALYQAGSTPDFFNLNDEGESIL